MTPDELQSISDQRAQLMRKQFYIIFMSPSDPIQGDLGEKYPEAIRDHLAFLGDLEARGILFAAGPFRNQSEWDGSGMMIIRAKSQAEAEEIARNEPLGKAGARMNEVRPWQMNEGSFTVTLRYFAKTFSIE